MNNNMNELSDMIKLTNHFRNKITCEVVDKYPQYREILIRLGNGECCYCPNELSEIITNL